MNAAELARAMIAAKDEIDLALRELDVCIREDAEADRQAKLAYATAYLATSGTVGERAAHSDKATAQDRYAARLAEGKRRSAFLAVEAKRGWLSALQSLAALTRSEAQLATWTPREVESA